MPLPLIPALVVAATAGAGYVAHRRSKRKVLTPARKKIFDNAMTTVKDPNKLKQLSAAFAQQGLPEQAEALAKRAKLRNLPAPIKAQRREAYKKGMKLTDPAKVKTLATAFQKEGATGAAASLNQYAAGLQRK